MQPSLYQVLAVIVISMLLGFFLGLWVFSASLNWVMRKGTLDIYVKGHRLEKLRMF